MPMVLLSLVEQLGEADEELAGSYAELGDWCAGRILRHVQVGAGQEAGGGYQTGPGGLGGRATPYSPPPGRLLRPHPPPSELGPDGSLYRRGDGARCGPEPSGREGGPRGSRGGCQSPRRVRQQEAWPDATSSQASVCSRTATSKSGWR